MITSILILLDVRLGRSIRRRGTTTLDEFTFKYTPSFCTTVLQAYSFSKSRKSKRACVPSQNLNI